MWDTVRASAECEHADVVSDHKKNAFRDTDPGLTG